MLTLNKYLREIGIDENYWLFADRNNGDKRYEPDEDGFINAETFNLDATLSMCIYSYLCYFRDNCMVGHPGFMTFEEWETIINKMIEAFKLQIDLDTSSDLPSKNKQKKINYGMRLFIKYYNHLWW